MKRPIKLPPWYDLTAGVIFPLSTVIYFLKYAFGWEVPRWMLLLPVVMFTISAIAAFVLRRNDSDIILLFLWGGILFFILFVWFGQTVLGWPRH